MKPTPGATRALPDFAKPPQGSTPKGALDAYSMPVTESGCHLWVGPTSGAHANEPNWWNYGVLWVQGRRVRAHRLAYELRYGEIPGGMIVRHKCDTPLCVNVDHLELGTHRQNAQDREGRGRGIRGARHHKAKLTPEDVILARALRREHGAIYPDLARRFGVTVPAIRYAVIGVTWVDLPGAVTT